MFADNGIVTIPGKHSVDETVAKIEEMLRTNNVRLFAVVDHSGEAEKAGLEMPPTKLLIFGNPKAGTTVMQAAPSAAIDLPLKILVAADAQGKTWLSYNSPEYIQKRHGFPENLIANLKAVEALAKRVTE